MPSLLIRNSSTNQATELKIERDIVITGVTLSMSYADPAEDIVCFSALRTKPGTVAPGTGANDILAMIVGVSDLVTAAGIGARHDVVWVGGLGERIFAGQSLTLLNLSETGTAEFHEAAAVIQYRPA